MIRPSLDLAVAINRSVRYDDEWFDESDELDRVDRALASIADLDDAVTAAGVLAYRVARAQAFDEGNKRTALLLAKWLLDVNGEDRRRLLPPEDRELLGLLVEAATGRDVQQRIVELLKSR